MLVWKQKGLSDPTDTCHNALPAPRDDADFEESEIETVFEDVKMPKPRLRVDAN